jgi:hypothetical protein
MQGQSLFLQNQLRFKSLQQQSEGEKELADLAMQAQDKGNDPLAVTYDGNNPYTLKHWGDVQHQYSMSQVGQKEQQTRTYINEALKGFLPEDFAQFVQYPRGPKGLPTEEGWKFFNAAAARAQARKEKVEDVRFGVKDTSLQKNITAIYQLEKEAGLLMENGDTVGAKEKQDQAALMREQMKGQNVVIGYDENNRPIVQIGKGGSATIGTQTKLQENMVQFENSLELMSSLQNRIKSGDVVRLVGNMSGTITSPAWPDDRQPSRIQSRTELGTQKVCSLPGDT